MDLEAIVLRSLVAQDQPQRYVLAYSGGADSTALLAILARIRGALGAPLGAVHVNHGLHADAPRWEAQCARVCAQLDIPCAVVRLAPVAGPRRNVEEWARHERYAALRAQMRPGDALLTAHHAEDQAETVLLALLRGSGPHGLRAMPPAQPFTPGVLLRPVLEIPGAALRAQAAQSGLDWVEDPSNRDPRHDRNFLRTEIMPHLRDRFPGVAASLARVARLQGEIATDIDALAADDIGAAALGPERLALVRLRALTPVRCAHALRYWVRAHGRRVPPYARLRAALPHLLGSRPDANPVLHWADGELRRFRDSLCLLPPLPAVPGPLRVAWVPPAAVPVPGGMLQAVPTTAGGLAKPAAHARVEIGYRVGGERARLPGRPFRSTLKQLFHDAGVPPWERDRTPLVYVDGALAAVAGYWVFEPFWVPPGREAWSLEFTACFSDPASSTRV